MPLKDIINLNSYKRKSSLKTFVNAFKHGYSGKLGNLISLKNYKQEQSIQKLKNATFAKHITKFLYIGNLILFAYMAYLTIKFLHL